MKGTRWRDIWMKQCKAAEPTRLCYGAESAFDYVVGGRLMIFAEAVAEPPEFARELTRCMSRVRLMIATEEMETHLARADRRRTGA